MKFHFFTNESSPYSFEKYVEISSDEDFYENIEFDAINSSYSEINQEKLISYLRLLFDIIYDADFSDLHLAVNELFDMNINGEFDWTEKTEEYYNHFESMIRNIICNIETDSNEVIARYSCGIDERFYVKKDKVYLSIPYFYSGNGEPAGAQLALDIVDLFMSSNNWNIGFYDCNGILVTDVAAWAKNNILDLDSIRPIVWFGKSDCVTKSWSITPDTEDLFIKQFWDDYYDGALTYICKSEEGMGIYYSVMEYGLKYDESKFVKIKNDCPINILLSQEERGKALYDLIVSIYNDNKD